TMTVVILPILPNEPVDPWQAINPFDLWMTTIDAFWGEKWLELRAALILLTMTVVILPILPNEPVDPWQAINPFDL
ncbi:hypothetical protein ACC745_39745, partial [Rhizobium ruizarguesonis]